MGTPSQEQIALLTDYDAGSAFSTAYHALYTNIALSWQKEQRQQHAIVLATPVPYPGHAGAAANVAIAAAQNGTPSILIDANLHAPSLHQRFGVNVPGLSDLLPSQVLTPQMISSYLCKTFVPDLRLLSAGQKQPMQGDIGRFFSTRLADLLSGLRQILQETEQLPGLIVFHCAPVLSSGEASLISAQVDQTFLVIRSGHTTRTQARQAQEQLQRAHAKLEGMVLLDI